MRPVSVEAAPALIVVASGFRTTVQDRGRQGWQRLGVPVSGAIDWVALAAANVVVGNAPGVAGLECLYQGPEVAVRAESVRVAVAGAGAGIEVLDAAGALVDRCGPLESRTLEHGQRARVRMSGLSISAYLAVEGGIAVPQVMGSRATYVRAAIGGFRGRVLRAGDRLPLARAVASESVERRLAGVALDAVDAVRVVLGPQDHRFVVEALETLNAGTFVVQAASDRMGLRLAGPKLKHKNGADIVTDGIPPGAIQVPADGQPIVMLADRQTTGGYAKIATVISADLPALGRLGPGSTLRFETVAVEAAEAAARGLAAEIASWSGRLAEASSPGDVCERLGTENLISGVADGTVASSQVETVRKV